MSTFHEITLSIVLENYTESQAGMVLRALQNELDAWSHVRDVKSDIQELTPPQADAKYGLESDELESEAEESLVCFDMLRGYTLRPCPWSPTKCSCNGGDDE